MRMANFLLVKKDWAIFFIKKIPNLVYPSIERENCSIKKKF